MGSDHVGKECQINSSAFEHAFKDAETVVFEVDGLNDEKLIAQKSQQYIGGLIQAKGIPVDPQDSLKGSIDAETYELLGQKTAAVNFPLANFAPLKPWVFIFAFTSTLLTQTEYKPECGLDLMTAKLAEAENKATGGLESLVLQLDKYTDLFISMDFEEISETIFAIADAESQTELAEYFSQEIDSLTNAVDAGDLEVLESSIDAWCSRDRE